MSFRHYLWILLSVAHLLTVICGAVGCLPGRSVGAVAQIYRWYANMAGADGQYGFFAPEVGPSYRSRFLLRDHEGSTWWDGFDDTISLEARLRFAGMVECAFANGAADELPDWRKRIVKLWAATMFSRHANAVSLTVVVEEYDASTMANYRAGLRPSWRVVYEAEMRRFPAAEEKDAP